MSFFTTTNNNLYHTSSTDISPGKTVWKSMNIAQLSNDKLANADDVRSEALNHFDSLRYNDLSLVDDQPIWCQFEGITCGTVPGTKTYRSIEEISISHLGLTGSIPRRIENFESLTSFDISDNSLIGSIPSSMGNLIKLNFLSLMKNSLTGTIPSELSSLTALTRLELSSNFLTMGAMRSVPRTTFAKATLHGFLNLSANCLAFQGLHQSQSASATRCPPTMVPTSSKYCS